MKYILALVFALHSLSAMAEWTLDRKHSTISFQSTKAGVVVETHQFGRFSADFSGPSQVKINIDLTSIDSGIPIRDIRMKEHLFATETFPNAVAYTELPNDLVRSLSPENPVVRIKTTVTLGLHGKSQKLPAHFMLTYVGKGGIQAVTIEPILVRAADFELVKGIEKLRDIAGLPSISTTVPVNVVLLFKK